MVSETKPFMVLYNLIWNINLLHMPMENQLSKLPKLNHHGILPVHALIQIKQLIRTQTFTLTYYSHKLLPQGTRHDPGTTFPCSLKS